MNNLLENVPLDYCTFWPDRLFKYDWSTCCLAHDIAYELNLPRLTADLELGVCVSNTGVPLMGGIMTIGLFIFGWVAYARAKRRHLK